MKHITAILAITMTTANATTFAPCPRSIDAPPITLTIINTQTPGVECARRAGNPLAALVLTAAAGCATDGLLIAPMDGPAALMSLGAFKTPDEMIGHEARHAIQRWRHAPLLSSSEGWCK